MSGCGITCQKNEYYMEKDANADFSICQGRWTDDSLCRDKCVDCYEILL